MLKQSKSHSIELGMDNLACGHDLLVEQYAHKKFGWRVHKQKRVACEMEAVQPVEEKQNVPPIQAQLALELELDKTELQPTKRRKTKTIFRPWLFGEEKKNSKNNTAQVLPLTSLHIMQYHANMVRSHPPKQRSPREQLRRYRNTLACLRNRRAKRAEELQLEQQYLLYRQQQEGVLGQSVRAALYLQHLMQLTQASGLGPMATSTTQQQPQLEKQQQSQQQLPKQQQVFVFGAPTLGEA